MPSGQSGSARALFTFDSRRPSRLFLAVCLLNLDQTMRIVMLGPPGSGKGTQAALLKKELNVVHISTGDLLRAAVAEGSELGRQVKSVLEAGELVSDELVLGLIEDKLQRPEAAAGFILDGYPRNLAQAGALDELLTRLDKPLDRVLELVVDEQQLVERIAGRASEEGRSDDSVEVERNRMNGYLGTSATESDFYTYQSNLYRNV